MSDWADEIARLLGCAACGDIETEETATALRKAKADGLKEAAKMVFCSDKNISANMKLIREMIRAAADKIENP